MTQPQNKVRTAQSIRIENKKAFQKWLRQCPENAFIDYQKQFREDPKKFKVVISFE